jgi:hypothetical protein
MEINTISINELHVLEHGKDAKERRMKQEKR